MREHRICTFCNTNEVETEKHFLLTCEAFSDLRSTLYDKISQYYCEDFSNISDSTKFSALLSPCKLIADDVGFFIHKMYLKRLEVKS